MKNIMIVIGLSTMMGLALVLFMIFAAAYMSPSKSVMVNIDNYGEAQIEMLMLAVLVPLNIVSTLFAAKHFSDDKSSYVLAEAYEQS